ncbi:retrovirus-related pol polyprotein from transposon TNT 1-94 [Tanacetum coccineum]
MMPCPCTTCLNHIEYKVEEVQFHLFKYGIDLLYTKWDKHGEKDEQATTTQIPVNATIEFVDDIDFDMDFGLEIPTDGPSTVEMVNATKESFDEDGIAKFQELLLDAEKLLYKGCSYFTKLSAIVKLLNLKGKYGASDKFFTELLGLLKKMLPAGNEMKDHKELTVCPTCGISRWKVDNKTHKVYENILTKAWRTIDEKFPEIAKDPRNLWLGISADGVDVNSGTRHHRYPGNDIDVFLQPLVDDLHTLFKTGVHTYDSSIKENFNLRAIVLWMINDYPALGTLCGCPYSGFKGCVVCGKDTYCVRLFASSKQSYAGHRGYLPYNHPFRRQKKAFNGQQEFQLAPNPLTGEQIYNENVCESLVGTLLNVPGKIKDGMNARLDLAKLGIKPELFARKEEDKTTLPPTGYTLTNAKKDIFCETLSNIRVERELAIDKESVSETEWQSLQYSEVSVEDNDMDYLKKLKPQGQISTRTWQFWGSKSRCTESDVKPSWKDTKKAKACMLAKTQASLRHFKAKVEACGSKAKLQASTKTLIVKIPVLYVPVCKKHNPNMYSPVLVTGCVLGLASVTTWDEIEKKMGARKSKTCADKAKGKRKVSCGS